MNNICPIQLIYNNGKAHLMTCRHNTQCAQNGKMWKKLIAADPVVQKSRQIPRKIPTPWGISGNLPVLQMLQQGPGIARRADRVGVLPLAPLASFACKNYLQKLSFFHLSAHCVVAF